MIYSKLIGKKQENNINSIYKRTLFFNFFKI